MNKRTFFRVYEARKNDGKLSDWVLIAEDDDMGYISAQYVKSESEGRVAQMFMVVESEELLG